MFIPETSQLPGLIEAALQYHVLHPLLPTIPFMRKKPRKSIDNLLGELGLHPDAIDPEEVAAGLEASGPPTSIRLIGPCGKSCYSSEANARKAGNRIKSHGANTSFLRSYFCPGCKVWHLTSGKNIGPKQSSEPKRNAGRNHRNHGQSQSTDES